MESEIKKRIHKHSADAKAGRIKPPNQMCVKCQKAHEQFKCHDRRQRKLRLIDGPWIKVVVCILIRWKCMLCKATFTHYPDFIWPHRRFVIDEMMTRSEMYLNDETGSYESCVRDGTDQIAYEQKQDQFFYSTTVMHWVDFWASLEQSLQRFSEQLTEKFFISSPSQAFPHAVRKHCHKPSRDTVLQKAVAVLQYIRKIPVFPVNALSPYLA